MLPKTARGLVSDGAMVIDAFGTEGTPKGLDIARERFMILPGEG
jgi:hypothetical protein